MNLLPRLAHLVTKGHKTLRLPRLASKTDVDHWVHRDLTLGLSEDRLSAPPVHKIQVSGVILD